MAKNNSKQEKLMNKKMGSAPKHVFAEEFGNEYAHALTSKKLDADQSRVEENLEKFKAEKE